MVVPVPGYTGSELVVEAPGMGPGWWAGGPSAVLDGRTWWLAYRLRRPVDQGRGYANVVATSTDGVSFEPVCTLERDAFGADSLERPALVRRPDGGWRIYVSCATPDSKHWRVDAIDADSPAEFDAERRVLAMPGDELTAVKDPVVHAPTVGQDLWRAWVCCHPLDEPGAEDRMVTRLAASEDGLTWRLGAVALAGRDGAWDQRGARVTAVGPGAAWALYDGRASAQENFEERAGWAVESGTDGVFEFAGGPIGSPHAGRGLRYVDAIALPDGGYRLFYESNRRDGAHELRTEIVGTGVTPGDGSA
jgi:hypothetical protein